MINLYKKLRITSGLPPFTYTWTSTTTCVTFKDKKGVTNEYVETELFADVTCLPTTVKLKVEDANGCSAVLDIDVDNPCILEVSDILQESFLTFSVVASNATNYTYEWTYPSEFTTPDSTSSTIILTPKNPKFVSYNTPYLLTVLVQDEYGCEVTKQYNFFLCAPTVDNAVATAVCNTSDNECGLAYQSATVAVNFAPYIHSCQGAFPSELHIQATSPLTTISNVGMSYVFCMPDLTIPMYTVKYFVIDSNGIKSNTGTINIPTPQCSPLGPCFTFTNQLLDINCADIQSTSPYYQWVYQIPTIPGIAMNWASFTFMLPNGASTGSQTITGIGAYTIVDPHTLNTPFGTAVFTPNHEIIYVVDTLPSAGITESIKWRVCDVNNCCSNDVVNAYIHECNNNPNAVDDDTCATCGNTSTINVTVNDTPSVQAISITTQPNNGIATISGLNINYTPNINFSGTDTLTYKIQDNNGNWSNEATVTIEVSCAGQPQTIQIC